MLICPSVCVFVRVHARFFKCYGKVILQIALLNSDTNCRLHLRGHTTKDSSVRIEVGEGRNAGKR